MDAKTYSEILKDALQLQIRYTIEDEDYENSEFLQGQEVGLMRAIEKIEVSEFLFKRGE